MTQLDFAPFDADNHYYEPDDAYTRHLEPEFAGLAGQPRFRALLQSVTKRS